MSKPDLNSDYAIGYGKPPVRSRFKKGRSGNPKGRPTGSLNLSTSMQRALAEKVTITEGGKRKKITKLEAGAKQFSNRIASGDPRAMQQLIGIAPMVGLAGDETPELPRHAQADQQVLAQILLRVQKASPQQKSSTPSEPESDHDHESN